MYILCNVISHNTCIHIYWGLPVMFIPQGPNQAMFSCKANLAVYG